jgi:hypothetical protein
MPAPFDGGHPSCFVALILLCHFEKGLRKMTWKGSYMKKADTASDEPRSEYRREDFGPMERGKYATRVRESSNVVVLDPEIAKAFPNSQALNGALRGLLELATHQEERAADTEVDTNVATPQIARGAGEHEGHARRIAFARGAFHRSTSRCHA